MQTIHYSVGGLTCEYPDFFKKKSDFPHFSIDNRKNSDSFLSIEMLGKYDAIPALHYHVTPKQMDVFDLNRETVDKLYFNRKKIFRHGECQLFPGSEEMLCGFGYSYYWTIVPVNGFAVNIHTMDSMIENLDGYYHDIITSIQFDSSLFGLTSAEYTKQQIESKKVYKWAVKALEKPKTLKRTVEVNFSLLSFFDSKMTLDSLNNFTKESVAAGIFKRQQAATLFVDKWQELNLSASLRDNPPDESDKKWRHISEGTISIPSGMMYISNYESEIKITLNPGNYNFRVYLGKTKKKDEEKEKCAIYFWPTGNPETNLVNIIKND